MATKAIPRASKDKFDYRQFEKDLRKSCAEQHTTFSQLSTDRFFRSEGFLAEGIKNCNLTLPIINSLADFMGTDLRKYEVKPKPEPQPELEPVMLEPQVTSEPKSVGWACQIRVDEEFGTAMMKVTKDGEEIALGRSYLYGHDNAGILQSISYAAHMCYKLTQQGKIKELDDQRIAAEQSEIARKLSSAMNTSAEIPKSEPEFIRLCFKDWMQQFEKESSVYGSMARYIKDHYKDFPENSEDRIKNYLKFHNGFEHMRTFKQAYSMYQVWLKAGKNLGS